MLYREWDGAVPLARQHLEEADAGMVTSYCPDGVAASELILGSRVPVRAFYDMDTPVTLEALSRGEAVPYLPPWGLGDFDLVLSFTGGASLDELRVRLGARRALPLYGSVDPAVHRPVPPVELFRSHLSYLPGHLRRGPPARAGDALPGSRPPPTRPEVPDRRLAVPAGLPLDRKPVLREARGPGRPPGVLLLLAHHPERHPRRHGADRVLPLGTALRGSGGRGEAWGVRTGEAYVDVGTLHGYREAIHVLEERPAEEADLLPAGRVVLT
ncbi:MAG TPA: hypothetical protein VHG28_17015 [Longimicrobiaceae bacterium]|nr:hypothetical protein [Longimicrobiaceae bacterium]